MDYGCSYLSYTGSFFRRSNQLIATDSIDSSVKAAIENARGDASSLKENFMLGGLMNRILKTSTRCKKFRQR